MSSQNGNKNKNVQATILDRVISYFAPAWGAERMRSRILANAMDSAYTGGGIIDRAMRRWNPTIAAPQVEYDEGTQRNLVARSRDSYRNNPVAHSVIERLDDNVVGCGLFLQSCVDHEFLGMTNEEASALERQIERDFHRWANSKEADLSRKLNFYQLQQLIFVSKCLSGDCFVNLAYLERPGSEFGLKLQVIEGDRVANPGMAMDSAWQARGIKFFENGAPVAYFVLDAHPNDIWSLGLSGRWIQAFNPNTGREIFLHCCDFEKTGRPDQARGVPVLAPIMVPLRQILRLSEAELMASIINAYFTLLLKSDNLAEYESSTSQTASEVASKQISLGPGLVQYVPPGYSPEFADPKRPNVQFDPFFTSIMKQISAGTSVPLEVILMHFTTSYWAARAALLQFWNRIKKYRANMVAQICKPVFQSWFDEYVARGMVNVKNYGDPLFQAAYTGASWNGPSKGSIDELKEANAAARRIEIGISDIQTEAQEISGKRWDDIHKQRAVERTMRLKDNLETKVIAPESVKIVTEEQTEEG